MNRVLISAVVFGAVAANGLAMGQRQTPIRQAATQRAASLAASLPPSPVLTDISIPANTMKVGKLLPYLKEKAPEFEYVVEAGPWEESVVPELRLHEVSLSQVISIVSTFCPTLSYTTIGGIDRQPVYVFRSRTIGGNADIRVQAFGISAIVDRLASRVDGAGDRAKYQKAREDTVQHMLSLIENTVNQTAEPGMKATVSFHAETETVLVKGTANQISTVRQALETFPSNAQFQTVDRLTDQLREAKAQIDSLHSELLKREADMAELKVRLEAAQRKNEADSKH